MVDWKDLEKYGRGAVDGMVNAKYPPSTLINDVPDPMVNQDQKKILTKMGLATFGQAQYYDAEQKSHPQLAAMFKGLEKDFASSDKYNNVLKKVGSSILAEGKASGFNKDSVQKTYGILDKLDADLAKMTPAQRSDFIKNFKDNPSNFDKQFDGYKSDKISLLEIASPKTDAPPPPSDGKEKTEAALKEARHSNEHKKESPKESVNLKLESNAELKPEPVSVATVATEKAPSVGAPPMEKGGDGNSDELKEKMLQGFAEMSPEDIKKNWSVKDTMIMALSIAEEAEKSGIPKGKVQTDFLKKFETDEEFRNQVTENIRRNPQFIKLLSQKALDEMHESAKNPDKKPKQSPHMLSLIEHPEKLASDTEMNNMIAGMKMADSWLGKLLAGMSEGLGKAFSGLAGGLGQAFKQITGFFSDMFGGNGGKSAISMRNGTGILPDFTVSLKTMRENAEHREGKVSVNQMQPNQITEIDRESGRVNNVYLLGANGVVQSPAQNPALAGLQNNPTNDRDREYKGPVSPNYSAT